MKTKFDNMCTVTCTHNDNVVEGEVDNFREKDSMSVYIATNKIHFKWNGKTYVGNMAGMEFTTPGPTAYSYNEGRR